MNGIREPNPITLVRIGEALQTRPDHLLGFGDAEELTARSKLLGRLVSAARVLADKLLADKVLADEVLADEVLDNVVAQTEALAAGRRGKPSGV